MLKKFLASLIVHFILLSGVVQAYDLPMLKPDKKIANPKKKFILKSDWQGAELFEQEIKARLASGEEIAPNDPARLPIDQNYVFIAFYNDAPYFLDKYSLKVKKNSETAQIWRQNIFPISQKFSPQNATSTHQSFCLRNGKFYNSTKAKDALMDLDNEADRKFLEACFKVGYYFAFGKEVTEKKVIGRVVDDFFC